MNEMSKLIAVNYEAEEPTVSARDLHEQLNIKTRFNDWFPRMCEYGFEESKDFYSKKSKTCRTQWKTSDGLSDFHRHGKADLYDSEIT